MVANNELLRFRDIEPLVRYVKGREMGAKLLTRERALFWAGEMTNEQVAVTIRPRSWNEGSKDKDYWALEGNVPVFNGGRKFLCYNEDEASQTLGLCRPTPTNVYGKLFNTSDTNRLLFTFSVSPGVYVRRGEGIYWTLPDIKEAKGLVRQEGKLYRLLPPEDLFG